MKKLSSSSALHSSFISSLSRYGSQNIWTEGPKLLAKKECKNIPSISKQTIKNEIRKHTLLLLIITKLHNLYLNAVENTNNEAGGSKKMFRYMNAHFVITDFLTTLVTL